MKEESVQISKNIVETPAIIESFMYLEENTARLLETIDRLDAKTASIRLSELTKPSESCDQIAETEKSSIRYRIGISSGKVRAAWITIERLIDEMEI